MLPHIATTAIGNRTQQSSIHHPKRLAFAKRFPEFQEEVLLEATSGAYLRDPFYHQGTLYITPSHVCFYSASIGKQVKFAIAIDEITSIRKSHSADTSRALLYISTERAVHAFANLLSDRQVVELLQALHNPSETDTLTDDNVLPTPGPEGAQPQPSVALHDKKERSLTVSSPRLLGLHAPSETPSDEAGVSDTARGSVSSASNDLFSGTPAGPQSATRSPGPVGGGAGTLFPDDGVPPPVLSAALLQAAHARSASSPSTFSAARNIRSTAPSPLQRQRVQHDPLTSPTAQRGSGEAKPLLPSLSSYAVAAAADVQGGDSRKRHTRGQGEAVNGWLLGRVGLPELSKLRLVAARHTHAALLLHAAVGLPPSEQVIAHFVCSLDRPNTAFLPGSLYITPSFLVFVPAAAAADPALPTANGLPVADDAAAPLPAAADVPKPGTRGAKVVALRDITAVHKHNTGLVVPNSILVLTAGRRYCFASLYNRDLAYSVLLDAWRAATAAKPVGVDEPLLAGGSRSPSVDAVETPAGDSDGAVDGKGRAEEGEGGQPGEADVYGFPVDVDLVETYRAHQARAGKQQEAASRLWAREMADPHIHDRLRRKAGNARKLVRKGIPMQYRSELWYSLSGALDKSRTSTSTYEGTTSRSAACPPPYAALEQIEKDLTRTFPTHSFFRNSAGRDALRRVLVAFSQHNPTIGYCQSMNFIAGLALLFMSEERAFWLLATIAEDLLTDYFVQSMTGALVDQRVFRYILAKRLAKIDAHLARMGFPLEIAITKWLMCLFVSSLPTETTLRVWDCLFFEGSVEVVLLVAAALFKLAEDKLLRAADTQSVLNILCDTARACFDADHLLKVAFNEIGPLKENLVAQLRSNYWCSVKAEMNELQKRRDLLSLQRNTHFSAEEFGALHKEFGKVCSELERGSSRGIDFFTFNAVVCEVSPKWRNSPLLLERLFNQFDVDGDAHISFKELMTGLSVLLRGSLDEKLTLCFHLFDEDKNGYLDGTELCKLLQSLYSIYFRNGSAQAAEDFAAKQQVVKMSLGDFLVEAKKWPAILQCFEMPVDAVAELHLAPSSPLASASSTAVDPMLHEFADSSLRFGGSLPQPTAQDPPQIVNETGIDLYSMR